MRSPHTAAYKLLRRRLVAARKASGLTQAQVARALRWQQSAVSNAETGERRIDVVELLAFARLYRKRLGWFVDE